MSDEQQKHPRVWFTMRNNDRDSLRQFYSFDEAWSDLDTHVMSALSDNWDSRNVKGAYAPEPPKPDTMFLWSVQAPVWVDMERIEEYLHAHQSVIDARDTDSSLKVVIAPISELRR